MAMYCPNCGEKLQVEDHRFCQTCGFNISDIIEGNKNVSQTIPISPSSPTVENRPYQTYRPRPIKTHVKPGPFSKKCLIFSILSVGLAYTASNLGEGIMTYTTLPTSLMGSFLMMKIGTIIAVIILHGLGLVFGILSKVNHKNAKSSEAETGILQLGNVFGIIGLIVNPVGLSLAIILAPFFIL